MKNIKVVVVSRETVGKTKSIGYEKVKLEEWKGIDGEGLLTHGFLLDSFRKLMGRTLTLIDSSIINKSQNKAMKDIVRNIYSDEMEFAAEFCFDQVKLNNMANKSFKQAEKNGDIIESVNIEDALGVEKS